MYKINDFSRLSETQAAYSAGNTNLLLYDLPQHYSDEYRSYDSPRLCTIINGAKEISVNQSEHFVYKKDKFVLLPPNSTVHMYLPEHTKALVYEFGDQLIDNVRQRVSDKLNIDISKNDSHETFMQDTLTQRIDALNRRIQEIVLENDVNMSFLIDLTCQEMVYELLKIKGSYDIIYHQQQHPISKAIHIMNSTNIESITISDIAEEVNMSPSNFSQQFKLITDQTPKEYMTRLRLMKAKQFLKNLSVTDTAYELGYDNISHFIRLFKQEYGMTPKQYQLNQSSIK